MKPIALLLLLLLPLGICAQNDFGGKSLSVPPSGNLNVGPSGHSISAPLLLGETKSSGAIQGEELNSRFGKQSGLQKPGAVFEEKLNKKESDVDTAIRKNQYLGDIRTKSGTVRIVYRDHEAPDGDMIRILVNDIVAKPYVIMEEMSQSFDLTLVSGFNKIDFEALNQGLSGPNTAEFQIYDDKGALVSSNRWNLAEGFKATVIVVKE